MKERKSTKKKTSSRASAVYISISVIAENAKKETPNAQPPLMADKIRAGYISEVYIMDALYRDTKREKERIISRERDTSPSSSKTVMTDSRPFLPNADNGLTAVALPTKTQQQKQPRNAHNNNMDKRASR